MKARARYSILALSVLTSIAMVAPRGSASSRPDKCPSAITVVNVKPVRGVGYSWVRATYTDGDALDAPAWAISGGADIRAFSEDEMYAYIAAPTGKYVVKATGPCGVAGEVTVEHTAAKP